MGASTRSCTGVVYDMVYEFWLLRGPDTTAQGVHPPAVSVTRCRGYHRYRYLDQGGFRFKARVIGYGRSGSTECFTFYDTNYDTTAGQWPGI